MAGPVEADLANHVVTWNEIEYRFFTTRTFVLVAVAIVWYNISMDKERRFLRGVLSHYKEA